MGKKEITTKEELLKIRSKLGIYVIGGSRVTFVELEGKFFAYIKHAGALEVSYPIKNPLEYSDDLIKLGYALKFPKFDLSGVDLSEPLPSPPVAAPVDALVIFMKSASKKSLISTSNGRFNFSKFNELMSLNGRK